MLKVLVPVDGSKNSDRAVTHAIGFIANSKVPVELHLLNVQLPIVSGGVRMFIKHEEIEAYHQDSGQDALRSARARPDARAALRRCGAGGRSRQPKCGASKFPAHALLLS